MIKRFQDLQNSIYSIVTNQNNLVLLFAFCAFFYVISAIVGTITHYSPVPFWDMWSGYLGFFTIIDHDPTFWWSQHNEHRIILSRFLFWIDIAIFHGTLIFLLIVNYLLIFASCTILFFCSKEISLLRHCERSAATQNIINFLILILLFSRMQIENLDQPFQSTFLLAQFLPLLSFYLFHQAQKSQKHQVRLFLLTCLIGLMSAGTMVNGILVLPLIAALSIFFKMKWRLVALPSILSAIIIPLYFRNYSTPVNYGLTDALGHPVDLIQYICSYLGNPFYGLFHVRFISEIAGLFLILNSIFFAWSYHKNPTRFSLEVALLAFIFYVEISAVMAGIGRLHFGIEQSFSSRYNTPALMSWATLLILYLPLIAPKFANNFTRFALIIFLIPISFLPQQISNLASPKTEIFEHKISVLATALKIEDREQLSKIFIPEWMLTQTKPMIERHLSIFGNPLFKNVNQLIGTVEQNNFTNICAGNLEKITTIEDQKYLQIQGWISEENSNLVPKIIHVTNSENKIIGYALGDQALGFKGYLLKEFSDKKITLRGFEPNCELQIVTNE